MAKMTFSNKWGRVATAKKPVAGEAQKSVEDVVREMKNAAKAPGDEDYREKSLRIHGLVCAKCGRDFSGANRHLLTVHHKDGNHHNNPQDGSNWENLCAYCHEDAHSRELLSDHLEEGKSGRETSLVYGGTSATESGASGLLAQKLRSALKKSSHTKKE